MAALRDLHRRDARGHGRSHPRRIAGRSRRDRVGADHRQTRRDLGAGQRRDVHLKSGACAVDFRLSHGGRRRHHVFLRARDFGAEPVAGGAPSNQEMGGGGGALGGGILSVAVRRRSGDAALLHHDRHRAHRRDDRPRRHHFPDAHGCRLCRAAAGAASGRPSKFPDVVRRDTRVGRRLSIRNAGAPTTIRR